MIEIKGLSKAYGKKQVLEEIDLSLPAGSIVGLLGPNGSGKTTLLKILSGLEKNFAGSVKIDGKPVSAETKTIVSYLPDRIALPSWMKAKDTIGLYAEFFADFDRARCEGLLHRLGLNFDQPVKEMSKGIQERLQIVLTMCRRARVYLLDEPLGGVDPATRDVILDVILDNYTEQSVVLLATHLIADVERIFDRVLFLKEKKIVLAEDVDNIRQSRGKSVDELFREVFKC